MRAYHLVYDTQGLNLPPFRVLLASKNVYGSYFHGKPTRPTVLNGAGQIVIPGGSVEATDPIIGGQIEFFEETGIDFRDRIVRRRMKCTDYAWYTVLDRRENAYCVFQQVEDVEIVKAACNEYIEEQIPPDQELHRTKVYDVSWMIELFDVDVETPFGPIPENDLDHGWRRTQYNQLSDEDKELARIMSQAPGDWYVKAVLDLVAGP